MKQGGAAVVVVAALAGCGTEPPFEFHLTVRNTLDSPALDSVVISSSDGELPGNPIVVTFATFERAEGATYSVVSARGADSATASISIGTECMYLANRLGRDIGSLERENRVLQVDGTLAIKSDTVDCLGTDGAVEDPP